MKKNTIVLFVLGLVVAFLALSSENESRAANGFRQTVYELEATTSAVSWSIGTDDAFDCHRITLKFSVAPTTAEDVTVTLDSPLGSAYDAVIRRVDPVGATVVSIEKIGGIPRQSRLVVAYTNTDSRTITGSAVCEI